MQTLFEKLLIVIIFLVLALINLCWSPDTFNTLAITRFDDLEKYYTESFLKKSSYASALPSPRSLKTRTLMRLPSPGRQFCERLLNTSFFRMKGEQYLDASSNELIEEIRDYYPVLFREMYELTSTRTSFFLGRIYAKRSVHGSRSVYVDGMECKTSAYPCLARDWKTQQIKRYFISDEYNLKADTLTPTFSVRFLFDFDHTRKLRVHALVEEPAWNTLEVFDVEKVYINAGSAKKQFKSLICKLTRSEKLRLCASVMNSVRYRNVILFRPTLQSVDHVCIRRSISFRKYEIADGVHKEWMIACRGKDFQSKEPSVYYLSLGGFSVNPVYVLRMEDDKFYLDHYAELVPVLLEKEPM